MFQKLHGKNKTMNDKHNIGGGERAIATSRSATPFVGGVAVDDVTGAVAVVVNCDRLSLFGSSNTVFHVGNVSNRSTDRFGSASIFRRKPRILAQRQDVGIRFRSGRVRGKHLHTRPRDERGKASKPRGLGGPAHVVTGWQVRDLPASHCQRSTAHF